MYRRTCTRARSTDYINISVIHMLFEWFRKWIYTVLCDWIVCVRTSDGFNVCNIINNSIVFHILNNTHIKIDLCIN